MAEIKRKRAPGGGRKPEKDRGAVKSETFTTRLLPQQRRALEEAAKLHSPPLSISKMAALALTSGLVNRSSAQRHNISLGCTVTLMAELVEKQMGKDWRDDSYTQKVLLTAILKCLKDYMPGLDIPDPKIPPAAAAKIAQNPPEFQTPDGVGFVLSSLLMNEIEQASSNPVPNEWTQPTFFSERPAQLAIIGHDLIIKRKGKSK